MLFPTFEFVFAFLPLSLSLYWMTFLYRRGESIRVMLAISVVFYFLPNWLHGHIIIASILVNFVLSKYVQKTGQYAKYFLVLGIIYNLAVIGYYKYSFFFGEIFYYLTDVDMGMTKFILPVGISFYTFQQIAYLVDCYKEKNVDYSFWHYSLFVTFFPQLIAGPIVHHKELLPQMMRLKNLGFNAEWFAAGVFIFIIGLAKKLLLADNLEVLATEVFSHADKGEYISSFAAWAGALSYTLQLYFDFSAYSDMAIGLGLMFGIRLPVNFLSPYQSESITEFWRRWHITLSAFLRDYLYIPLGGNRSGAFSRYRNLMLTMLIGGLWHGAGFNFIIWGGLHGLYLMVNHAFQSATKNINLTRYKPVFVLITLFFVVIAWVFFRAETLNGALIIISQMLSFSQANNELIQVQPYMLLLIGLGFFITQFTRNVSQMFDYQGWKTPDDWQPITIYFDKFKLRRGALAYISCLLAASLMFMAQPTVFIYFNF